MLGDWVEGGAFFGGKNFIYRNPTFCKNKRNIAK